MKRVPVAPDAGDEHGSELRRLEAERQRALALAAERDVIDCTEWASLVENSSWALSIAADVIDAEWRGYRIWADGQTRWLSPDFPRLPPRTIAEFRKHHRACKAALKRARPSTWFVRATSGLLELVRSRVIITEDGTDKQFAALWNGSIEAKPSLIEWKGIAAPDDPDAWVSTCLALVSRVLKDPRGRPPGPSRDASSVRERVRAYVTSYVARYAALPKTAEIAEALAESSGGSKQSVLRQVYRAVRELKTEGFWNVT